MPTIELVVSDSCLTPLLHRDSAKIQVVIGLGHDFDDILDLAANQLSNEEIAFIHRLWSDDTFPRSFTRVGDALVITARD